MCELGFIILIRNCPIKVAPTDETIITSVQV